MTNIQTITLKDLRSLYDLKVWLREKANIFHGKNISKDNMLIFLNYLKEKIKDSDLSNKTDWLDILITLEKRLEATTDDSGL